MATTVISGTEEKVKNILTRAKHETIKGRYYVYERYKAELQEVCESSVQLGRATIELARILKV